MKISSIVFTSVLALGLMASFTALPVSDASAGEVKGKIEGVMKEGRSLKIGGKTYFLSGSRTNVCIKGKCDQDRGMLKAGMTCEGMTSKKKKGMEFKKVSCK